MNKPGKKSGFASRKYIYCGALFLLIQFFIVIRNLGHDYYSFFWFCAFAPLLFAIGFFFKDNNFIKGLINITLIPQILFLLDLLCYVLFGKSFSPTNGVLFSFGLFFIITTFLVHLSATLALLFTYKEKPSKKTLYYSFFILILLEIITLLFTHRIDNINFVYLPGEFFKYFTNYNPYYTSVWVLLAFIVLVIPTHLIQHLIYKIHEKCIKRRSLRRAVPHRKSE